MLWNAILLDYSFAKFSLFVMMDENKMAWGARHAKTLPRQATVDPFFDTFAPRSNHFHKCAITEFPFLGSGGHHIFPAIRSTGGIENGNSTVQSGHS